MKDKIDFKYIFIIASYFGLFQALMPFLGYQIGYKMYDTISLYDHYIILIILSIIGINMCLNSFKENDISNNIIFKEMIMLAIATSIDAFTVGITYSFFKINIYLTCMLIGLITFLICFIGVIIGHKLSAKLNINVELIGGIILILLGIKIFLEHI